MTMFTCPWKRRSASRWEAAHRARASTQAECPQSGFTPHHGTTSAVEHALQMNTRRLALLGLFPASAFLALAVRRSERVCVLAVLAPVGLHVKGGFVWEQRTPPLCGSVMGGLAPRAAVLSAYRRNPVSDAFFHGGPERFQRAVPAASAHGLTEWAEWGVHPSCVRRRAWCRSGPGRAREDRCP